MSTAQARRRIVVGVVAVGSGFLAWTYLGGTVARVPEGVLGAPALEDHRGARVAAPGGFVFEENRGQAPAGVEFIARGAGVVVALAPDGATLSVPRRPTPASFKMRLVGANAPAQLVGVGPLPGKSHYFRGGGRRDSPTNVPHYAGVRYREPYPGVDVVFHTGGGDVQYDFIVAPGADPSVIRIGWEGIEGLEVSGDGSLLLRLPGGPVVQRAPVVFQETPWGRQQVAGGYALEGDTVGFEIGDHDAGLPLVIDPVLSFSSYLGGSDNDVTEALATDPSGNVYVVGRTSSSDFPTQGVGAVLGETRSGSTDGFLAKLDPGGSLVYAAYLGGGFGDSILGVAVDSAGAVYLTGETASTDFPTKDALQKGKQGVANDVFVTKLAPDGSALVFSTYLGGAGGNDTGHGIAVDGAGNVYVTGTTQSTDFPTAAAMQSDFGGGFSDAFAARILPGGSGLAYSTYLGGVGDVETGRDVAADGSGNAYITGNTNSSDFPTANAIDGQVAGFDAFVTKLTAGGTLAYSTFLGGGSTELGYAIEVDAAGNAYIGGQTAGSGFPTVNPFQGPGGGTDGFVAKIDPNGAALVYSSHVGGSGIDTLRGLARAPDGSVHLVGETRSPDFPTARAVQPTFGGGGSDAFWLSLNAAGSAVIRSTYLGGSGAELEWAQDVGPDGSGGVWIAGFTDSADFPTARAIQPAFGGGNADAFVVRLAAPLDFWIAASGARAPHPSHTDRGSSIPR